jgi:hypothetical protein
MVVQPAGSFTPPLVLFIDDPQASSLSTSFRVRASPERRRLEGSTNSNYRRKKLQRRPVDVFDRPWRSFVVIDVRARVW